VADHKLKTWPREFGAILSGRKVHEWRRDDRKGRSFSVNDRLHHMEFAPCPRCAATGRSPTSVDGHCCEPPHGHFTGRTHDTYVTFVSRYPEFGIPEGWVVMSIAEKPVALPPRDPRLDPEPGDRVEGKSGDKAEVLAIYYLPRDCDPALGLPPHVEARIDPRAGQRRRSTMSLETWRAEFAV